MPRTVLVVDDNKINRRVLRRILSPDYSVIEAEDGQEAMEALMKEYRHVSAVLLDLLMPVLDGYGVLERMRQNPTLSQIPVIVTTGDTEAETEKRALALGANDFVAKPVDPDILRRRLENLIKLRETSAMINNLQKDKLTGLWNREAFFEKAAWEIRHRPDGFYAMVSADIDGFKLINDRYGTAKGDEVLKALGKAIVDLCRSAGAICGRMAADNFVLLYPSAGITREEDERRNRSPVLLEGLDIPLTVSVGRYYIDDRSLPVSAMYDRAKLARGTIKGRYDVHVATYDEAMHKKLLREQEIANEMKTALAGGQFEAWYQPQYNHRTGALVGAEALARWRHPRWGLVSPGEFVPVFERSGFVYELDKYIWEQVCAQLRRWKDEGRNPLPVSVNISRYDLFREDLVSVIVALREKYGLGEDMLRLEITESAFAESTQHVVDVVRALISRGFTVEIDDFGSGYSSLNTLKDVPAQILKLDMRFMGAGLDSSRGGNILESVVRMSKWLGMSVIAEGVESKTQADYLKSVGCDYIQGYLYARPMTARQYETMAKGAGKEERLIVLETVENLDSSSFWNPESMDTLIFNSFVGAACIFEYQNGRIELIRATDKFTQTLGNAGLSVEDALKLDWGAHMDEADKAKVDRAVRRSIETKDSVTEEYLFWDFPGCPERTYLRSSMRAIATAGDRVLIYCTNENITAQREAEQEKQEADEQLRFLSELANELLAHSEIESGIDSVLCKIFDYFGADCAIIMELDDVNKVVDCTYEAHRDGVKSRVAGLRGIPYSIYDHWLPIFDAGGYVDIEDAAALPDSRAAERELICSLGVRSLVSVPFERDGSTMGFICLDNPSRRREQAGQLRALGDYLAIMLTRRDLTAKIESDSRAMRTLMDDTPGGFVRMRLLPEGGVVPAYCNHGFCKLLGITPDQILGSRDGITERVHPDDMKAIWEHIAHARQYGDSTARMQYRLLCGDGEYRWFSVFGRITRSDTDETFLNMYYTDIAEQEEKALTMRETMPFILSAIMESSSDLTFAKDAGFSYLCCSPAFARLVGKDEPGEVVGRSDYDLFDRETADRYRADDLKLIEGGVSLVDYVEVIPSDDGVPHYSSTSKHILRDSAGRTIGIYGIGRDVTGHIETDFELDVLLNTIPSGVMKYAADETGAFAYVNRNFVEGLGYTEAEFRRKFNNSFHEMVYLEDREQAEHEILVQEGDGGIGRFDYRIEAADGTLHWFHDEGVKITDREGKSWYYVSLFDITQAKLTEEALRVHEEELRIAMSQMGRMICEYDVAAKRLTLPATLAARCGSGTVVRNVPESVVASGRVDPEYVPAYIGLYDAIQRGEGSGTVEYHGRWNETEALWLRLEFSNIFDSEGRPTKAIIAVEDITQEKNEELDFKEKAEHDPLTGVLNRTAFAAGTRSMKETLAPGAQCAMLMMDIDGFKQLNDTMGHAAGDQALIDMANALRSVLRPTDLLGRLGGDEFAVGLPNIRSDADIAKKAEQIGRLLRKDYGDALRFTVSIGIAVCPRDGEDFETVYRKADAALYSVKYSGKDSFAFYEPGMDMSVQHPAL